MDISNILKPDELPFPITDQVRKSIEAVLKALEEGDPDLPFYEMELESDARDLCEENDMWIRRYYLEGGYYNGAA